MALHINEAAWDRTVRVIVGALLLVVGWGGFITGTVALVFTIGGFLMLVTGLTGWCPAYALFGVSTCPTPRPPQSPTAKAL